MRRRSLEGMDAMTTDERLTLLDLVAAVHEAADDEAEAIATIRDMLESGRVSFDAIAMDSLPEAA